LAAIHVNPHISTRVMAREIGIPRTTIQRILKQGNYHPYHVTLTQALTQNDMQLRVHFCLWAQQMIRADQNFFYHVMFSDEDHLPQLLEDVDLHTRQRMRIQLDGAPPHYAVIVRNFLNQEYNNRWIGRGGPVAWPPRSPDLTSPDFFLWGYIKNVVYEHVPTTRENMMERIRTACVNIQRAVLLKTVRNFQNRLALCIQGNGDNFEQFIR
ncbi:hypothetical protein X777_15034, partial [Ooceraea biroi]